MGGRRRKAVARESEGGRVRERERGRERAGVGWVGGGKQTGR